LSGAVQGTGGFFIDANCWSVRIAHIDDGNIPIQQFTGLLQNDNAVKRPYGPVGGQQDPLIAVKHDIPAPLAHADKAAHPLLQGFGVFEQIERLGDMILRAIPRNQR
jgi:hypothetical protein